MIVAIDGPAGVGKSTIAKTIAEKASLFYVNSGNFYRAITLEVIENKLTTGETNSIIDLANNLNFSLINEELYVNNVNLEDKLHSDLIDSLVAEISSIVSIRRLVNTAIRKTTESMDIIVEGRDISTVVFPNADLKVYLDASVATRALRRFNQGVSNLTLKEIEETIHARDQIDKSKPEGSLKISDDALYLDTSDLTIDEVCDKVLQKLGII